MFPYRRQGPKKRKGNPPRRSRGPMRPLPNSARELIPLLQPTTKALAQVLAGRSGDQGQLAHAQSVLAHAERLVADRQANRLNPAEREELFEQLARLKLTITDAETEAEIDAEGEETPREPPAVVGRDRLREMALALGSPRPADSSRPSASITAPPDAQPADGVRDDEATEKGHPPDGDSPPQPVSEQNRRAGRLQLTVSGGEEAATAMNLRGPVRRRGARPPARLKPVASSDDAAPTPEAGQGDAAESEIPAVTGSPIDQPEPAETHNGHPPDGDAEESPTVEAGAADRRDRARRNGIPEGWVIDDEGFVVPGPA